MAKGDTKLVHVIGGPRDRQVVEVNENLSHINFEVNRTGDLLKSDLHIVTYQIHRLHHPKACDMWVACADNVDPVESVRQNLIVYKKDKS